MCKTGWKVWLLLGIGLMSSGCGEPKKGSPATATPSTGVPHPSAEAADAMAVASSTADPKASERLSTSPKDADPEAMAASGDAGTTAQPAAVEAGGAAVPVVPSKPLRSAVQFEDAQYLSASVVGLAVAHPRRFLQTPLGELAEQFGAAQFTAELAALSQRTGLKLDDLERVTIVVDQRLIDETARNAGLNVAGPPAVAALPGPEQFVMHMKMIGLAFHNYHDTFGKFPRAEGDANGTHTGLSWRVHLLPFLDQAPLYNQFNFDEAWDSEHNKSLIAQMPAVFRSPGVTDEQKTALHVFTGDETIFRGDNATSMQEITDGTSNTILAVQAGPDTAEIWTKPGGLEFNAETAKKSLGEIEEPAFLVLSADGGVREVPFAIDNTTLAHLIQRSDGVAADFGVGINQSFSQPMFLSSAVTILSLAVDVNREMLVKGLLVKPVEETHAGVSFQKNEKIAVWIPTDRTVILGPIASVKEIITAKQAGKSGPSSLVDRLRLDSDISVVIDVESQTPLLQRSLEFNPVLGMILNLKTVAAQLSTAAIEGESLFEMKAIAVNAEMAAGLSALASGSLAQGQASVSGIALPPTASDSDRQMQTLLKRLVNSTTITTEGAEILLRVPVATGFDQLPELLKSAMTGARRDVQVVEDVQRKNVLKQLGLAFHNFESSYRTFPGAGKIRKGGPTGLSWRVHLLPFLDHAALYDQFHRDEPWDSEHNKTLIAKMPEIFQSPGVDDAGKTSYHVFTGPGAPFADDQTPALQDFKDGTSNTILVVLAGPDTAGIWTKPGGLDFDVDDPIKSLGDLIGETFMTLFADGSVHGLEKNMDSGLLLRLIQFDDGKPTP
jgi:hypothetical protein